MKPLMQFVRGVLGFGSARMASQLVLFVLMIVLARICTPDQFGNISFALATANILLVLSDLGMSQAVQKYVRDKGREVIRPAFAVKLTCCVAFSLVVYFADYFFGAFKGYGGWIGAIVFASAFQMIIMTENAKMHFRRAGLYQISTTFLFFAGSVGLALAWDHVAGPLAARTVSFAIVGLPLVWLLFFSKSPLSFKGFGPVMKFGLLATANSFFTQIYTRLDMVMLTYLAGFAAAGHYRTAHTLAIVPMLAHPLVSAPLMPVLADQIKKGNLNEIANLQRNITNSLVVLMMPVLVGGMVLAEPLIRHLFGEEYVIAAWALRFLILGNIVYVCTVAPSYVFYMDGRIGVLCGIGAINSIVIVAGNLFMIPRYGVTGAAIVTCSALLLGAGILLVLFHKRYGLTWPGSVVWRLLGCTLAAWACTWLLRSFAETLAGMLAVLCCTCITYTASLVLLRVIPGEKIKRLAGDFFKKR